MTLDISKMGFAFATKRVAEEGRKVKFMYRESPDHPDDSGWRFFCGEESQEYVDDPENTGIFSVGVIAKADPAAYTELGSLQTLNARCWSQPTLSNGRIYGRDEKGGMYCVDVRK